MKTFIAKPKMFKNYWYIVDAKEKILGRIATKIAFMLRGKHKVEYTPNVDIGDYIIVLNADKVVVSGNKYNDKFYYHYTGYIGGIKKTSFKEMITINSKKIIEIAVKGMLPKGPLGRSMFRKLKIYEGTEHKHSAQQPKVLNI